MANEAFFEDGVEYTGAEFRRLLKTFYTSPDPLGGVIFGLGVVLAAGSAVKVKTGAAFVPDTGGGAYIGATQADSAPLTITPTSTGDRQDTVYAFINDPGEMAFGVAAGSTTIPGLAIPLAHVTAHNDGSLTIADVRIQVRSSAEKSSDTGWVPLTPLNGWATYTFATDTGPLVRRVGNVVYMTGTIMEPWNSGFQEQVQAENSSGFVALQLPVWAIPTYAVERMAMTALNQPGRIWGAARLMIQGSHLASHPQTLSNVPATRVAGAVSIQMPYCGSGSTSDGPNAASLSSTWLAD